MPTPRAGIEKPPPPEGKHRGDVDGWIAYFEYWRPQGPSQRDEECYQLYLKMREEREAETAKTREIEEDADKAFAELAAAQAGSSGMQG